MAIYVTSDTHFNHKNILSYEPVSRPFINLDEMNGVLIHNWNKVIKPEDTVIHCGDFFMGELDKIDSILGRLNGKIILVRGNHDTKARLEKYKSYGIEIHDIYYYKYKGRFFIFCHFPIANEEFIKMVREDNSEVIVCYGHIHSNAQKGYVDGTYHIGADTNDLTPISLEQIWQESWPAEKLADPAIEEYKSAHERTLTTSLKDCAKCVNFQYKCGGPIRDPDDLLVCPINLSYKRDPPDGGYYG